MARLGQSGPTSSATQPAFIVKNFIPNGDLLVSEPSGTTARRGAGLEEEGNGGAPGEPETVAEEPRT